MRGFHGILEQMFQTGVKRCSSILLNVFLPIRLMIMSVLRNSYSTRVPLKTQKKLVVLSWPWFARNFPTKQQEQNSKQKDEGNTETNKQQKLGEKTPQLILRWILTSFWENCMKSMVAKTMYTCWEPEFPLVLSTWMCLSTFSQHFIFLCHYVFIICWSVVIVRNVQFGNKIPVSISALNMCYLQSWLHQDWSSC